MTSRATALAAWIAIAACGSTDESSPAGTRAGDRIAGPSAPLGGGDVSTYALGDGSGGVTHVGARVPLSVLGSSVPASATVAMPSVVARTTFFDHVFAEMTPDGGIALYFVGIPTAAREAIACTGEVAPPADVLPAGYAADPAMCRPQIGVAAHDGARAMTFGYHDGRIVFLEPMLPRAQLDARQSFSLAVPRPTHLDRKTRWPTRFDATFDPATDSYALVFSAFVPVSDVPQVTITSRGDRRSPGR